MHDGIVNALNQGVAIEYTYIENVATTDASATLEQLAGEYDVIIAHGSQYPNAVTEVAEDYPDQIFVVGTSDKILGDNIFTYMPQSEETGYLNGIASALISGEGKVGVVGSANMGDAYRYARGFVLGYRKVYPDATEYPVVAWTGSFNDIAGAGDLAETMINSGCDVLTGPSQQAVGALSKVAAASDQGVLWTAQSLSQMADYPEVTVCAADYEYSAVIVGILERMSEGVRGGVCIPMNYSNNGFVFEFGALATEEVISTVNEALEFLRANPESIDYNSVNLD